MRDPLANKTQTAKEVGLVVRDSECQGQSRDSPETEPEFENV
jgi:hypothetical protein